MNIPYALRRLLAAAVCLAAVQPAAAADLSGSSFVRQAADRASYELLETVTDRCEDVANILEGIVIENS